MLKIFFQKKIKISQEIINLLIERSNGDRGNLKNELEKLENLYLTRKNFKFKDAEILTNLSENYSVFELSDNYLAKNSKKVSIIKPVVSIAGRSFKAWTAISIFFSCSSFSIFVLMR